MILCCLYIAVLAHPHTEAFHPKVKERITEIESCNYYFAGLIIYENGHTLYMCNAHTFIKDE